MIAERVFVGLGMWFLSGILTLMLVGMNDRIRYGKAFYADDFEESAGMAFILGPFGLLLCLGTLVIWAVKDRR